MKTKLFLFAAAALVAASCTFDETTEVNLSQQIEFRGAMDTRATEVTTDNLSTFNVYAYNGTEEYFSDKVFTKNAGIFTSNPAYDWPTDNSTLKFYAYAPASVSPNASSSGLTLAGWSPAPSAANQVDFVVAEAQGSYGTSASGVVLTFSHELSQIVLKAKNAGEFDYSVKGVRLVNALTVGNYSNGSFAATTTEGTYEVLYDTPIVLGAEAANLLPTANSFMILPQTKDAWVTTSAANTEKGTYMSVFINIKSGSTQVFPAAADAYEWVAVPVDFKWDEGTKYEYVLDFSNGAGYYGPDYTEESKRGKSVLGAPITFTANVTPWTSSETPVGL